MTDFLVAVIFFVAGLVTGSLWREAAELLRGKDTPQMFAERVQLHVTHWLTAGLLLSMVLTSVVGVAVILEEGERDDLVSCITDYNERVGKVRDIRIAADVEVVRRNIDFIKEDIDFQQDLINSLGDSKEVTRLLKERQYDHERYLKSLEGLASTRREFSYPPPDSCEQ